MALLNVPIAILVFTAPSLHGKRYATIYQAPEEPASSASAPSLLKERLRLIRFYEHYRPEMIPQVDYLLNKYAGKEAQYFQVLVRKYGPEPEEDDDEDIEDYYAEEVAVAELKRVKERLIRFYQHYKPDKIPEVDYLLNKYPGRERDMFQVLEKKYGPELPESPPPSRPNSGAPLRQDEEEEEMFQVLEKKYGPELPRVKERLIRFYQHYNPDKISEVDYLLDKYPGRETDMFQVLEKKYGPELPPPLPDSPPPSLPDSRAPLHQDEEAAEKSSTTTTATTTTSGEQQQRHKQHLLHVQKQNSLARKIEADGEKTLSVLNAGVLDIEDDDGISLPEGHLRFPVSQKIKKWPAGMYIWADKVLRKAGVKDKNAMWPLPFLETYRSDKLTENGTKCFRPTQELVEKLSSKIEHADTLVSVAVHIKALHGFAPKSQESNWAEGILKLRAALPRLISHAERALKLVSEGSFDKASVEWLVIAQELMLSQPFGSGLLWLWRTSEEVQKKIQAEWVESITALFQEEIASEVGIDSFDIKCRKTGYFRYGGCSDRLPADQIHSGVTMKFLQALCEKDRDQVNGPDCKFEAKFKNPEEAGKKAAFKVANAADALRRIASSVLLMVFKALQEKCESSMKKMGKKNMQLMIHGDVSVYGVKQFLKLVYSYLPSVKKQEPIKCAKALEHAEMSKFYWLRGKSMCRCSKKYPDFTGALNCRGFLHNLAGKPTLKGKYFDPLIVEGSGCRCAKKNWVS